MNIPLILTVALLPAIALLYYIWKKDKQKEPTSWLLKAVVGGATICMPVAVLEMGISMVLFGEDANPTSVLDTTAMAFFDAALPEETFKLLVLWIVLRKNPYFDEHFDGIVYAVCVGLGFAAVENVGYVMSDEDNWVSVAIARSLMAVPGHYAFAVLMGYYYSIYHFVDHSPKVAVCVLLVPVVAHGIYDALAMSSMVNEYIGGVCSLVLIYFCVKMHKVARAKVLVLLHHDETDAGSAGNIRI